MKGLRYLFLLIPLMALVFLFKTDTHEVPRIESINIKYFLRDLIEKHDFSYTIFGSKPMSLADYGLRFPRPRPSHRWIRSLYLYTRLKAGLHAWHKYSDHYSLNDFIFLYDETDWINDCLVIFLINKRNMHSILCEHESIFKEELGEAFSPESFLESLEGGETSIAKAINRSQKLMGIMLGYGVRNATLFQERFDVMKAIWRREKESLPEDQELTQKLANIQMKCGNFSELDADAIIHPLYFLADVSHPETIALQQKYEQDRQRIIVLRSKHNFMDLVLKRLSLTTIY